MWLRCNAWIISRKKELLESQFIDTYSIYWKCCLIHCVPYWHSHLQISRLSPHHHHLKIFMVTIFWWRSPRPRSRWSPRPRSRWSRRPRSRWSYHGSWWWVGHQTWYPPSIVSPENESFSRRVKVATKSQSKAVPKTRPSLCSSVKSTGQFLHLFEHQQQTNKKTSKLHCFCPRFHFSL